MINKEAFRKEVEAAEMGNIESVAVVREVLRPKETDTVEEIKEKIYYFNRIVFLSSLEYKDADYHYEIDEFYAEQIESLLKRGVPKYKGALIIGHRESAKTTRVKFNEAYMTAYLAEIVDMAQVVSESASGSTDFVMDLYNTIAFSRMGKYYPNTIKLERKQKEKKESQTMTKFTTTTGVTYRASSARVSKRGGVKADITDDMEVETKRPKKVIFDDIENESTIRSLAATDQIGRVMSSTIDGLDQAKGFFIIIGNYLSLRGNIAKYLKKYEGEENYKVIKIPVMDGLGQPLWPGKYVRTDKERDELLEQGKIRVSIETLERTSDHFEVEFMNNPKRFYVYFSDELIASIDEDSLVDDSRRDDNGLLEIQKPERNASYLIGADSAKGTGDDQSAFVVWRLDGLRFTEVANFFSNTIVPEKFARLLDTTAVRYNQALVVPENNYPGNEVIAFLSQNYNNIYYSSAKKDEQGNTVYDYGVNTNAKTKPQYFLNVKQLLESKLIEIRSRALYTQLLEIPHQEILIVRHRDTSGGHFDLLTGGAVGLYVAPSLGGQSKQDDEVDYSIKRIVDDVFSDNRPHR